MPNWLNKFNEKVIKKHRKYLFERRKIDRKGGIYEGGYFISGTAEQQQQLADTIVVVDDIRTNKRKRCYSKENE